MGSLMAEYILNAKLSVPLAHSCLRRGYAVVALSKHTVKIMFSMSDQEKSLVFIYISRDHCCVFKLRNPTLRDT